MTGPQRKRLADNAAEAMAADVDTLERIIAERIRPADKQLALALQLIAERLHRNARWIASRARKRALLRHQARENPGRTTEWQWKEHQRSAADRTGAQREWNHAPRKPAAEWWET